MEKQGLEPGVSLRKEIWNSLLYPVMKLGDDKTKKSDADPVKETDNDNQGVDFLIVLQVGGGIIAVAVMIYLILHYILHVI